MSIHKSGRRTLLFALCLLTPAWVSAADLYVTTDRGTVYKIPPTGIPSVFVGGLNFLEGVAVNSAGNVFIGFGTNINEFTPTGSQSTFASGVFPFGLAFDPSGNLFEADANGVINKFTPAGVESTFATGLSNVQGIACDGSGDVFLADGESTVYEYSPSGVRSTFATGLDAPVGLAFDPSGNLFVSATNSGTIYKYTASGVQSTFATGLPQPWGLACDADGDVYDAEIISRAVYEFSPSGTMSTFATGLIQPEFMSFDPPTAVPEPSTLVLAVLAAVMLGGLKCVIKPSSALRVRRAK